METLDLQQIKQALKPIRTEAEYRDYLSLIDALIDCEDDTPELDVLELISILVEQYEHVHYPIEAPDPIEAIKLRMEQKGLKQKDLVPYIGSKSRVSEILNRKRPLTIEMVRSLHVGLGLPIRVLVQI